MVCGELTQGKILGHGSMKKVTSHTQGPCAYVACIVNWNGLQRSRAGSVVGVSVGWVGWQVFSGVVRGMNVAVAEYSGKRHNLMGSSRFQVAAHAPPVGPTGRVGGWVLG